MQKVKTTKRAALDPLKLNEAVLKTYEEVGFPREIVGSWAISENDVDDFVKFAAQAQPARILEIGTYVGVSTMLLALVCPDAEIYTVDPDLPLSVEMGEAVTKVEGVDHGLTTHAIARLAAERLSVANRIRFCRGGFSVGDTFDSILRVGGATTEIIGPELCKKHGPFDFIFVDGLHSAEAVAADLELAASALTADGVMILHDCIGYWGANVRGGVFRFLRSHPEFEFTHPRYSDIYKSVGVLRQRRSSRVSGYPLRQPFRIGDLPASLHSTLARLNATLIGEKSVVEIGFGQPILQAALQQTGRSYGAIGLSQAPRRQSKASVDRLVNAIVEELDASNGQAVFSADLMDFAPDELVNSLFAELVRRKIPIVLAVTPPGETGVAGPFSRPIGAVIDLAEQVGLAVYELPALDTETERYALLPQVRDLGTTSLFTFFVVLTEPGEVRDALGRKLSRLEPNVAGDREQIELQRVQLSAGYRLYYGDRNNLLDSNSKAGARIKFMEESLRGLQAELVQSRSAAEQNQAESLRLANRFAELSEGLTQAEHLKSEISRIATLEQQIDVLRQELESERAEGEGFAQQLLIEREEAADRIEQARLAAIAERDIAIRARDAATDAYEAAVVERSNFVAKLEHTVAEVTALSSAIDLLKEERRQEIDLLKEERRQEIDLLKEERRQEIDLLKEERRQEIDLLKEEHWQELEELSRQLRSEQMRSSEAALVALDVFQTMELVDSRLRSISVGLSPTQVDEAAIPRPSTTDPDDTFAALVAFRQRVSLLDSAVRRALEERALEIEVLRNESLAARDTVRQLHLSTSWKVTSPLRVVMTTLSSVPSRLGGMRRMVRAKVRGRRLIALQMQLNLQLSSQGLSAPVFDADRYATVYGDVPASHALRHYLMHGEDEGRRPTHKFDPLFYRAHYPDVDQSGASALLHFLTFGLREGRSPCAEMHPLGDLARMSALSPLEYFARH